MSTSLTGTVERIVFAADDSGYTVARFHVEDVAKQRTYDDFTTIVGKLGKVSEGETLLLNGEWERHPKHGRHFRVDWFEHKRPSTVKAIEKFLGSGVIKGVGPATAAQVVKRFGQDTLDVIEQNPERLREVPKLTKKRAEAIVQGWREHQHERELMLFLQAHELPMHLASRLRARYGDESVAVLQRDPYQLVRDVYGIGFKTSDAIALRLGLPLISTSRYVAAIIHVLEESARDGHVFVLRDELLRRTAELLALAPEQLEPGILDAARERLIVIDGDRIYATRHYRAEVVAAELLRRIRDTPTFMNEGARFQALETAPLVARSLGITLAERQIDAVVMALREKVSVITGGPGTGKTMCLLALITALTQLDLPFTLCAPTGRAAKRMSAATGREASTIHRLLGYQPADNSFARNESDQLESQVVIVDEVSMVDILLITHLLRAIPPNAHLVLVGDSDQLPAVGPGNVLADLLNSGVIPAVELDQLFRQAAGSDIHRAAHEIRNGHVATAGSGGDFFVVDVPTAERAQAAIEELVLNRIPKRFGLDPKLDVQVLSPIHRGPAGVTALNNRLQELLNASASTDQIDAITYRFRTGDKVMQIRNNYDKEVFNGDVGIVLLVDLEKQELTVDFSEGAEKRSITYEFGDLKDLTLAYAVSIHKAQGSEFPCVVFPVLTNHYALLQRNLIYTALTRAKQLCVVVQQPQAMAMAVRSNRKEHRNTWLAARLQETGLEAPFELDPEPLEPLTALD